MGSEIGRIRSVAIAIGGVAAILGLYWDDAWHTDVGRDDFLSPPHMLLYAGVALLLAVATSWAWSRYRRDGWSALTDPVLALPLAGAALTLASAPVDEMWHQLFGRDAVTWSPPHMVAVAGMFAFAAGLYLAVQRTKDAPPLVAPVVGAFLIAAAVTPVMEFETDVPQFPVVLYWPVLAGMLVFAFALVRRVSDSGWVTTQAATIYVVLRLVVIGFLAGLGHSLPTVMPTVAAAWVFDLLVRRGSSRLVTAAGTTLAIVGSHYAAHVAQPAGLTFSATDLAVGAVLGVVATWVALTVGGVGRTGPGSRRSLAARTSATVLVAVAVVGWASPALAHDPGQGAEIAPVTLVAARSGDRIDLTVVGTDGSCADWEPDHVVARRAGRTLTAPLSSDGTCRYQGSIDVDDPGRWFVYAEIAVEGELAEAWIPVEHAWQDKDTVLYAAPVKTAQTLQIVAGVVLYVIVIVVMAGVAATYRRAGSPGR